MTDGLDFPTRLRATREQHGLTQGQLAEGLGVNLYTVCRWENGATEPKLSHLIALALFLGVSIDWLAGIEESRGRGRRSQRRR